MNWLKYLVGFSALIIAGCAAYFSVTGLGVLFSGAAVSVMVMASALEVAKLVAARIIESPAQRGCTARAFLRAIKTGTSSFEMEGGKSSSTSLTITVKGIVAHSNNCLRRGDWEAKISGVII